MCASVMYELVCFADNMICSGLSSATGYYGYSVSSIMRNTESRMYLRRYHVAHRDLTHGHRHLLVLPDDLGSCDLRRQILLWKNATFIQHNGLARTAKIGDSYSLFPCYAEGKDVMIPPTLGHRLGPNWESIQSNMDKVCFVLGA